jgi:hypothetical protein
MTTALIPSIVDIVVTTESWVRILSFRAEDLRSMLDGAAAAVPFQTESRQVDGDGWCIDTMVPARAAPRPIERSTFDG